NCYLQFIGNILSHKEMLTLLQKLWAKLQGLPTASPLEMGAFAVLWSSCSCC
uniref:Uncharacterized protein n=1 Tax=Hucho hucho TaxID=62062 RepID=A0A4W5P8A8_9TELE